MRSRTFLMLFITFLLFIECGNKEKSVQPTDGDHFNNEVGAYIFLPHGAEESLPSSVNLFFNVLDTSKTPVHSLMVDGFIVKENGIPVDHKSSAMGIRKRDSFDYQFNTILMLDVSASVSLEMVKSAARAFVSGIDTQQFTAVYTFSDRTNLVQDFTQNTDDLLNAIESITSGSSTRNLFSAIKEMINQFNQFNEQYALFSVQQSQIVVFTGGDDTNNDPAQREEVIYTGSFSNVYTIGYGNDLDLDFLARVGNRGFLCITDESKLEEAFVKTQSSISMFADSFYRLVYRSSLRGNASQIVEISIMANLNDGEGSKMEASFRSDQFVDISKGLYVNWMASAPMGVDTIIVGINIPRRVVIWSLGYEKSPVYEWSCADPAVIAVEPADGGIGEASLVAMSEGNTSLIVRDTANGVADTVTILAVQSYDGYILREYWENISGSVVEDLTSNPNYPYYPTGYQFINKFEGSSSSKDQYGARLRGYVHPSVSGTYSFWIASDDASQLYFSTEDSPANKKLIAKCPTATNARLYTTFVSQHSADFILEASKYYYIEALHKDGGEEIMFPWHGTVPVWTGP